MCAFVFEPLGPPKKKNLNGDVHESSMSFIHDAETIVCVCVYFMSDKGDFMSRSRSLYCHSNTGPMGSTESVHAEMSELALELGEDMGLLYTDAAHVVLDSPPRSPRRAVDIEAGLGRREKWASSLQVQDATGHHPHDGCEPLQREALNAAEGKSQPKLSSCLEAALEGDDHCDLILDARATLSSV